MKKLIRKIWEAICLSFEAVDKVFNETFNTHSGVMSRDAMEIMSNPEDRKRYVEAIRRLKNGESKQELFEWKGRIMHLELMDGPTIIN